MCIKRPCGILHRVLHIKTLSVYYLRTACFIFSGSLCRFSLPYYRYACKKNSLPAEKSYRVICTYLIYG